MHLVSSAVAALLLLRTDLTPKSASAHQEGCVYLNILGWFGKKESLVRNPAAATVSVSSDQEWTPRKMNGLRTALAV